MSVDGQQFQGHRCILSKFSKMLNKMFKTEVIFCEENNAHIYLVEE